MKPQTEDVVVSGEPARLRQERRTEFAQAEGMMALHPSTFEYLKPSDEQIEAMARVRAAAKIYCDVLEKELPEGPDKTFIIRAHRSNAMWVNVAITRLPDGTPRSD